MNFNYSTVFLTIATSNIQTIVDFYSHVFQSKPTVYLPKSYAEFVLGNWRLAIFQPKPKHESEFSSAKGGMSLCIEVENLEQAIACLTEMGYAPPGEIIEAKHGKEIYGYDPDGNRLILHQSNNSDC